MFLAYQANAHFIMRNFMNLWGNGPVLNLSSTTCNKGSLLALGLLRIPCYSCLWLRLTPIPMIEMRTVQVGAGGRWPLVWAMAMLKGMVGRESSHHHIHLGTWESGVKYLLVALRILLQSQRPNMWNGVNRLLRGDLFRVRSAQGFLVKVLITCSPQYLVSVGLA